MIKPPNFEPLGRGFYIVRTQAGFRKAARHHNCGDKLRRGELVGFPKSYPCFVSFSDYMGYQTVANCIHLSRLSEAIQKSDNAFKQYLAQPS